MYICIYSKQRTNYGGIDGKKQSMISKKVLYYQIYFKNKLFLSLMHFSLTKNQRQLIKSKLYPQFYQLKPYFGQVINQLRQQLPKQLKFEPLHNITDLMNKKKQKLKISEEQRQQLVKISERSTDYYAQILSNRQKQKTLKKVEPTQKSNVSQQTQYIGNRSSSISVHNKAHQCSLVDPIATFSEEEQPCKSSIDKMWKNINKNNSYQGIKGRYETQQKDEIDDIDNYELEEQYEEQRSPMQQIQEYPQEIPTSNNNYTYECSSSPIIIKICDGLYLGNIAALTDQDSLESNYMTHIVKVVGENRNLQGNICVENVQLFVSETVQYVHTHGWMNQHHYPDSKNSKIQQFHVRQIVQLQLFIKHAKSQGESVLIVSTLHINTPNNNNNPWMGLIPSASIACQYIMHRFNWSLFKTVDYITNRLTSSIRAQQVLKQASMNIKQPKQQHCQEYYEELLFYQLLQQQKQDIPAIPIHRLKLLQIYLMEKANRTNGRINMSYNWQVSGLREDQEDIYQQIVITNTYLNSSLGNKGSYLNVLTNNSRSVEQLHRNNALINNNINNNKSRQKDNINRCNSLILPSNRTNSKRKTNNNNMAKTNKSLLKNIYSLQKNNVSDQQHCKRYNNSLKSILKVQKRHSTRQYGTNSHKKANNRRVIWFKDLIMNSQQNDAQQQKQHTNQHIKQTKIEKENIAVDKDRIQKCTKSKIILSVMDMIKRQYGNNKNSIKGGTATSNSLSSSRYNNNQNITNKDNTTTKTLKLNKNNKYNKSLSKLPTIHQLNANNGKLSHAGSNKYLSHNSSKTELIETNSQNNNKSYCDEIDYYNRKNIVMMDQHTVQTQGYVADNKRKGILDITEYPIKTQGAEEYDNKTLITNLNMKQQLINRIKNTTLSKNKQQTHKKHILKNKTQFMEDTTLTQKQQYTMQLQHNGDRDNIMKASASMDLRRNKYNNEIEYEEEQQRCRNVLMEIQEFDRNKQHSQSSQQKDGEKKVNRKQKKSNQQKIVEQTIKKLKILKRQQQQKQNIYTTGGKVIKKGGQTIYKKQMMGKEKQQIKLTYKKNKNRINTAITEIMNNQ